MKEPNLREQFEKEGGMNQYTMGLQRVKKIRKATRKFSLNPRPSQCKCGKMNIASQINGGWKWVAVGILIIGAIPLSFNLPAYPFSASFLLFFLGHFLLGYLMYLQKEYSLVTVNIFWCILDIVGIIRWI